MFKFAFEVEEDEESDLNLNLAGPSRVADIVNEDTSADGNVQGDRACYHVTLPDLLACLPETISYSPLYIPGLDTPILRRDLFDARFQLTQKDRPSSNDDAQDAGGEAERDEDYVDSSTDLVPGLYEGGLKTWEGGVDLIEVLSGTEDTGDWISGSRVIEVGCGTAIPSAFLLSSMFSSPPSSSSSPLSQSVPTVFHMQDFNKPVLELVTLPNLLLALLPHIPPESFRDDNPESNEIEEIIIDPTKPGLLHITEGVKQAFTTLLKERNIELQFTYGHWAGLAKEMKDQKEGYDLVMTSETIYEEKSVEDLLSLLKASFTKKEAGGMKKVEIGLEDSLGELQIDQWRSRPLREGTESVILVAAKVLYFGVGGGVQDFLKRVEGGGGWYENVKEWVTGVGRRVFRVGW